MPRKKGTPKTGGRTRGQPNRVSSDLREFVTELLNDNRQTIKDDLRKVADPAQRLSILEKYLQYSLPKLQSVDVTAQIEAQVNAEYVALENLLQSAPDEVVQRIADKVIELSNTKKQTK
jgi:hypothetical protein